MDYSSNAVDFDERLALIVSEHSRNVREGLLLVDELERRRGGVRTGRSMPGEAPPESAEGLRQERASARNSLTPRHSGQTLASGVTAATIDTAGRAAATTRPYGSASSMTTAMTLAAEAEGQGVPAAKGKKRKKPSNSARTTEQEDGGQCSICLDQWTSKGEHRICTLLCGHLFGQSCIEKWLKERRSCPQCGAQVGPKNSKRVIPLFLSTLVAKDTGELETARKLLDEEKRLRKQAEAGRIRLSVENKSLKDQLLRLRRSESVAQAARQQAECLGAPHSTGKGPVTPAHFFARGRTSKAAASLGGPPSTGNGHATSEMILTPGSASKVAPPMSGSASRGVAFYGEGVQLARSQSSPLTPRVVCPSAGRPTSRQEPAIGPASEATMDVGGDRFRGESGAGADSYAGGSSAMPGDMRGVGSAVYFERVLSKGLRGGRVAAFAEGAVGALLVSQEFGIGYASRGSMRHGITKFSVADLRHSKNICLHREQVRDVKFSAESGFVLSTATDRTLKVCDLRTDSVVLQYDLEGCGWSCQWSATQPSQMFCGIADANRTAAVLLYDLRSTAGAVGKLRTEWQQRQPVHSICHTIDDEIIFATVGGVWAWGGGTKSGDDGSGVLSAVQQLQIQAGTCCSISQSHITATTTSASQERFLVSTRGASASHAVFSLKAPSEASRTNGEDDGHNGNDSPARRHEPSTVPTRISGTIREWPDREREDGSGALLPGTPVPTGPRLTIAPRCSWAERWTRLPIVAQGHQSRCTLARSLLWEPVAGAGLFIAGGNELTNEPWVWDATGRVCNRLSPHTDPVVDVASCHVSSSGMGLFAAVSQGQVMVYQTSRGQCP